MRYRALITAVVLIAAGPPEAAVPPSDCSPDAVRLFSTKVQPILQNACVNCHAAGNGGTFVLRRQTTNGANTFANTQTNLSASLEKIDRQNPAGSLLLTKALTPHGGGRMPPLPNANSPAFRHLEQWVRLVAGPGPAKPAAPSEVTLTGGPVPVGQPAGQAANAATPIRDEFDPEIFNRETKGRQQ